MKLTNITQNFYFILDILSIEYWQDIFEILLISIPIYYFLIFLKKDKQTNMLFIFYSYVTIFFLAYIVPLSTLQITLWYTLPIVILLFIILHESRIQKNIVLSKKLYTPSNTVFTNLEELAKCTLYALNKNKEIIFVIEQENNLKSLISSTLEINADLSKEVFEILVQKHIPISSTFILLNQNNNKLKINSINSSWNQEIFKNYNNLNLDKDIDWKSKAVLITSKTDAIIFKVNSLIRNFDLIAQGKIINNLNAEKLFLILSKYMENSSQPKLIIPNKNSSKKQTKTYKQTSI